SAPTVCRVVPAVFVLTHTPPLFSSSFFSTSTATTPPYPLSLHDALPISRAADAADHRRRCRPRAALRRGDPVPLVRALRPGDPRSEEHTSELQSLTNLVCRLLLEKKNKRGTEHPQSARHLTDQSERHRED